MKLKRFETSLVFLFIVASLVAAGFAAGAYLFLVEVLDLSQIVALFVASLFWLYMLMLLGARHVRAALRPVNSMYGALEHLAEDKADSAPPDPEASGISKGIVEQVIKDVYDIHSGTSAANEHVKKVKAFEESLINNQSNAIITLDRHGRISFANKAAVSLLPSTTESPVGMTFDDAFSVEYSSDTSFEGWLAEINEDEEILARHMWERVRILRTSETVRYFDMIADFYRNEEHGIETIVVLVDKTESYNADDEQIGFVSLAVHELRSPISLLRGYIEVFDDELTSVLDDEQRMFMQKMTVAAGQLSTFVNNILNVARIENDQLQIHIHEDTIYDAINSTMEDFILRAEVRNRKLKYELDDGIGTVGLDRVAFYEVLSNLIDNAIKYSENGGEIEVHAKKREEGGVTVTITDHGIGIPSSSMNNLFERFYRSHHSRDKVAGTGLGLFLSKRIIEAHGGSIWVQSKEGEGSTFGIDLPSYESLKTSLKDERPEDEENVVRSAHGWIKNHGKVRK